MERETMPIKNNFPLIRTNCRHGGCAQRKGNKNSDQSSCVNGFEIIINRSLIKLWFQPQIYEIVQVFHWTNFLPQKLSPLMLQIHNKSSMEILFRVNWNCRNHAERKLFTSRFPKGDNVKLIDDDNDVSLFLLCNPQNEWVESWNVIMECVSWVK